MCIVVNKRLDNFISCSIKYNKTFMKLHFSVFFEYFKLRAFQKVDPGLNTLIERKKINNFIICHCNHFFKNSRKLFYITSPKKSKIKNMDTFYSCIPLKIIIVNSVDCAISINTYNL